ncbi:MAG: hypothetical protein ACW99Q_23545 [Candidatus Kariarchaeaceae archaeon]|jgi:hypothetical protein
MGEKERSLVAYEYYKESLQKFEYYFTGLIGILCVYISQSFVPDKIDFSPNTLELVSLIIFIISLGLSLIRISKVVQGYRLNHNQLHLIEIRGGLKSNLLKDPGKSLINEETGDVFTTKQAELKITQIDKQLPKIETELSNLEDALRKLFVWRNMLFVFGFFLLISSKIWNAYYLS